eukprot:scaffold31753_cov28-Prasinocladus_malaysianus.AAC.1
MKAMSRSGTLNPRSLNFVILHSFSLSLSNHCCLSEALSEGGILHTRRKASFFPVPVTSMTVERSLNSIIMLLQGASEIQTALGKPSKCVFSAHPTKKYMPSVGRLVFLSKSTLEGWVGEVTVHGVPDNAPNKVQLACRRGEDLECVAVGGARAVSVATRVREGGVESLVQASLGGVMQLEPRCGGAKSVKNSKHVH